MFTNMIRTSHKCTSKYITIRQLSLTSINNKPLINVQTTLEKNKIPENFKVDFCNIMAKTLNKNEKVF